MGEARRPELYLQNPCKKARCGGMPLQPQTRGRETNGFGACWPARRVCLSRYRLMTDPASSELNSIPDDDTSG